MRLTDLLDCGIDFDSVGRGKNPEIKGITDDSRKVRKGFLFVSIRGNAVDGTKYIADAIKNGAAAILTYPGIVTPKNIITIAHENPRYALGFIAAKFFGKQPKNIAAVTGTNGKTSVADFTRQLWHLLGNKAASIGTIGIFTGLNKKLETDYSLTTPGLIDLHETISSLAKQGITNIAMEASSHGLDQDRMAGVNINIGAFTNLSRDHLDYHANMKEYLAAKMKLFSHVMGKNGTAIINADIAEFKQIKKVCQKNGHKIIDYGFAAKEIKLQKCTPVPGGIALEILTDGIKKKVTLPLYGGFQASNVLCALGIVLASGKQNADEILKCLPKLKPVRGRMEKSAVTKSGAQIFVDYAHTPDALEKALQSLRAHLTKGGKLVVVFGCGGDRDKGKRPLMGKIAAKNADVVIVTDDNPRTEEPKSIRKAILAASKGAKEVADRKKAIAEGIKLLRKGDILLIAGKGHETTQIVGKQKFKFDDAEISRKMVKA